MRLRQSAVQTLLGNSRLRGFRGGGGFGAGMVASYSASVWEEPAQVEGDILLSYELSRRTIDGNRKQKR